jgi:hypothetical protein
MKKLLITSAIATSFAGVAFAEDTTASAGPTISGEVGITLAETAAGDMAGSMGLDLGIDAAGLANIDLDFSATDGNAVVLDNWTVGTSVAGIGLSIGDDNGLMPDAEGNQTLAKPAMAESVKVEVAGASVAVGFTDWGTDLTDLSNLQGSYTLGVMGMDVTAALDYNFDTENTVLGAGVNGFEAAGLGVGGALSYDIDAEKLGFETTASIMGATAYLNGDTDETLQNIGGEYVYNLGGAEVSAGANYNFDAEEFKPSVGLTFSF